MRLVAYQNTVAQLNIHPCVGGCDIAGMLAGHTIHLNAADPALAPGSIAVVLKSGQHWVFLWTLGLTQS